MQSFQLGQYARAYDPVAQKMTGQAYIVGRIIEIDYADDEITIREWDDDSDWTFATEQVERITKEQYLLHLLER